MLIQNLYDLIIIGGGPAGLSAARAGARAGCKTLLLEKLAAAGELGHPCSGAIAPIPGFVSGQRTKDGLQFRELDLDVPASLIVGSPCVQRYISPGGFEFQARFPTRNDLPIAVIEKPGLLRLIAQQASNAGAELRFGSSVSGLIKDGQRIAGVHTHREEFYAQAVISAEEVSRQFTEAAGLYDAVRVPKRYAFIVSEVLDAPAAQGDDVGQISTLGKRYTSVTTPAFGTTVIPAPGRAEVYFSVFADEPQVHTDESLWHYLEEYKQRDHRISGLLQDATVLRRAGTRMVLRPVPKSVVQNGFIGVGDSIGPGGHVGILPSMYLGQMAARAVAHVVHRGDTSVSDLKDYERVYHGPILHGLDTDYHIITSLSEMRDDRLCQTLSRVNLAPFFFGEWQPILAQTVRWLVTGLPLIVRDWRLIQRMMSGKTS